MNNALRPSAKWHDPLRLIQDEVPGHISRIVLRVVCCLVLILIVGAAIGKLDMIATAEGRLVTQTLLKIVQPAEAGVIDALLVQEGEEVHAGQLLARLNATLANADKTGIDNDLFMQQWQLRRIQAQLHDQPLLLQEGDDPVQYAQVYAQYTAHRQVYQDSVAGERATLAKLQHEWQAAKEIADKLAQTLPAYKKTADAYTRLQQEGFMGALVAEEKQREYTEKSKDHDAQRTSMAALQAGIQSQQKRLAQVQSAYKSELEKERAEVQARIAQLQPALEKTRYKEGLMELRAPQDGTIKDLATTTVGAVVQPGTVLMSLVPKNEPLYADVDIKNEDIGFIQPGQKAQIKLMPYPFQKYGMLEGEVVHISADASETKNTVPENKQGQHENDVTSFRSTYKVRIKLQQQVLTGPGGTQWKIVPGMQVVAEIHQGKRTVLAYLLSPVKKVMQEAGRER